MAKTKRKRIKKSTKQAGLGTAMFLIIIGVLVAAIGMRFGGALPFYSGWGIVAAGGIMSFIGVCKAMDTPPENDREDNRHAKDKD